MSTMKEQQDERDLVYAFLREMGAIKTCPIHDDFSFSTGMDPNKVYAIATNKYKEYYHTDKVPQHFREIIKQVLDSAFFDAKCPFGEKNISE